MGTLIDLSGQKYNLLTVIKRANNIKSGNRSIVCWECVCECGNRTIVRADALRNGTTKSCGCKKYGNRVIDEIGNRYGRLIVIERKGSDSDHKALWLCKCDCGGEVITTGKRLRQGIVTSCGCLRSSKNQEINLLLQSINVKFKSEFSFKDLKSDNDRPLRFDFAILNKTNKIIGLIEYEGEEHYIQNKRGYYTEEKLKRIKQHDLLKQQYCKEKNIPLLCIKYDYFNQQEILEWVKQLNEID